MTINERIIQAVTPVVSVCVPDLYDPNQENAADEFCVFSYTETPDFFADNTPQICRYTISLVWAMPIKRQSMRKKKDLTAALLSAGFDVLGVYNVSDEDFQQYEFELEYTDFLEDAP